MIRIQGSELSFCFKKIQKDDLYISDRARGYKKIDIHHATETFGRALRMMLTQAQCDERRAAKFRGFVHLAFTMPQ